MTVQRATIVDKPWGHEEIFARTDRYVGKVLFIRAGEALSLQYHERKEETLRVLEGTVLLAAGEDRDRLCEQELQAGDVFHVAPRCLHRMVAVTDCRLVEVSTPETDDVVRLEDRYGREGTSDP